MALARSPMRRGSQYSCCKVASTRIAASGRPV